MEHKDTYYNVWYDPTYLGEFADECYDVLVHELFGDNLPPNSRRTSMTFGDDGLIYRVEFGGYAGRPLRVMERKCVPWHHQPVIQGLRDVVSRDLHMRFNCCVVQWYPHGGIGIPRHRDKEMKGATIVCLSFGATRKLIMTPPRYVKSHRRCYVLNSGSLYVLRPPTNDHWMHEIEIDYTVHTPRLSLTFRNLPTNVHKL